MTLPLKDLAPFTLYIDADACPRVVKELIFKSSIKNRIPVLLVANRFSETPKTRWIKPVVVEAGPDVADDYIVEHIISGDLAITADIPLAAQIVEKGIMVIDHRGKEFTKENIKQMLAMRNFSADMREVGVETSSQKPFSSKDREGFANALNRCLTRLLR